MTINGVELFLSDCVFITNVCLFFVLGLRGARRIYLSDKLPAQFAVITNRLNRG